MKSLFLTGTLFLCPLILAQDAPQATPAPAQTAPPPPAAPKPATKAPSGFEDFESFWSVGVFYWRPDRKPVLRGGLASTDPNSQGLDFPGKPRQTPGILITLPTGHSNRVEISAFQTKGSGSLVAPIAQTYFGQGFNSGDRLTASYNIRNIKATWNYLSYPYPALDARFRVKTLWEVQYVGLSPVITGPQVDLTVPAPQASGKMTIILPTLGLGVELVPSPKHFRFEARATGMAFPGRAALADAEANAVFRLGKLEVFGGGKFFYFRSSPKKEQFMRDRLFGPVAGVRWVFGKSR